MNAPQRGAEGHSPLGGSADSPPPCTPHPCTLGKYLHWSGVDKWTMPSAPGTAAHPPTGLRPVDG